MRAGVSSATYREFSGSLIPSDDLCAPGFVRTSLRGVEIETRPRSLSLKCVLEGEEVYETPNSRLVLRAGDLALIGADQKVLFGAPKRRASTGVSVFFPTELQRLAGPAFAAIRDLPAMRINGACAALDAQAEELASLSSDPERASAAGRVMIALMQAAAGALTDILSVSRTIPARKYRTRLEHGARLLRAKKVMSAEACARRTVDDFASSYGFSRHSFARHFKRAFGVSPRDFLEETRMSVAADLIATTASPFQEIAARAGYPDYPTFSKAFSRRQGLSPAEWRKQAQTDMATGHRAP